MGWHLPPDSWAAVAVVEVDFGSNCSSDSVVGRRPVSDANATEIASAHAPMNSDAYSLDALLLVVAMAGDWVTLPSVLRPAGPDCEDSRC